MHAYAATTSGASTTSRYCLFFLNPIYSLFVMTAQETLEIIRITSRSIDHLATTLTDLIEFLTVCGK